MAHGIFEKCPYGCLICVNAELKKVYGVVLFLGDMEPRFSDEEANHDSDV